MYISTSFQLQRNHEGDLIKQKVVVSNINACSAFLCTYCFAQSILLNKWIVRNSLRHIHIHTPSTYKVLLKGIIRQF